MAPKKKESVPVYKNGPTVTTSLKLSNDGKWLIHKTIITDIKAVPYYETVLKGGVQ